MIFAKPNYSFDFLAQMLSNVPHLTSKNHHNLSLLSYFITLERLCVLLLNYSTLLHKNTLLQFEYPRFPCKRALRTLRSAPRGTHAIVDVGPSPWQLEHSVTLRKCVTPVASTVLLLLRTLFAFYSYLSHLLPLTLAFNCIIPSVDVNRRLLTLKSDKIDSIAVPRYFIGIIRGTTVPIIIDSIAVPRHLLGLSAD